MEINIKQLEFLALHFILMLVCYWVPYFSMLTCKKQYSKWYQRLMPYLRCVIGIFFVAVIFSGANVDYFFTRYIECILPAFFGILMARGKEGTKYKKYMDSFGNMH
jgi:hypothetical protein